MPWVAFVVTDQKLDLLAKQAALGVDLVDGERQAPHGVVWSHPAANAFGAHDCALFAKDACYVRFGF
jgi:hypothetical protein